MTTIGGDEVVIEDAVVRLVRAVEDAAVACIGDVVEIGGRFGQRIEQAKAAEAVKLVLADLFHPELGGEGLVAIDQRHAVADAPQRHCRDGAAQAAANDDDVTIGSAHLEFLRIA